VRHKNGQWNLETNADGTVPSQHVTWALQMDIRDELQVLNSRFASLPCILRLLRAIERQLKLQRRCPVHPRYTARRKPTVDCSACRRYYRAAWK